MTIGEIGQLEANGCRAEDWSSIVVADGFSPEYVRNVSFYGEVQLGVYEKKLEISKGFFKHSGIYNATLRNASIGDNCLVENVGGYINNYTIGDDCLVSNVSIIETIEGATYGEGNLISVLNEAGDGNAILFGNLNSQFAAFMVKHFTDKNIKDEIRRLINEDIERNMPERGIIGNNVRIVGTKEITNCVINDSCEINGASRLSDCSILNGPNDSVYIGTGVICENSIICNGSSIINSVKMEDCFVGEACHIANGFTASQSVFFANSYMSNGEACAAFCGPFSASHHKSSLLIGGQFSFYNAGSNTNFSNHAYKMGPIHYGMLERGTKTASGSYVLMPAKIGAFSVCMGKLMHHPDTRDVPFSYLISYNDDMYLVPGRNITTVGLYRDIKKWPKRDMRQQGCQKSIVNFDWLSPFTVGEILRGKKILERPTTEIGKGNWIDLSGLLLPESEEARLIADIKNGTLETIQAVIDRFEEINSHYREYQWTWTYQMILDYYGLDEINEEDALFIRDEYIKARRAWIAEIRKDAEKEYAMGDVEDEVFADFINKLDHEIDYEDQA